MCIWPRRVGPSLPNQVRHIGSMTPTGVATNSEDEPAPAGHPGATTLALAALVAVYLAQASLFAAYVNDDAYITFRYSRFLALGRGPYFNFGEHVEGYTNFALMVVLSGVIAVGGAEAAPWAAKAVGVLSGASCVVVSYLLARFLARRSPPTTASAEHAGLLAAGLLAVSPAFALNSMSGLETTLFGALVSCGVLLGTASAARGRWLGSGIAFGAAALTRPEGALLFAIYWSAQALSISLQTGQGLPRWRALLRQRAFSRYLLPDALVVTVVVVTHVAFRMFAYDGELVPNTYFAKVGATEPTISATGYVLGGLLPPFLGVFGALSALLGLASSRGERSVALPATAVALTGALLPLLTGADWMLGCRTLVPYFPIVASLVALGWYRLTSTITARYPNVANP